MKKEIFILLMLLAITARGQQGAHYLFDSHNDIGDPKLQGSTSFNPRTQEYVVNASGENIWNTSDQFHFIWKVMNGDFVAYAKFRFSGDNTEPHRKAGWMFRQSLEAHAPYVNATVHGDGLTSLQYRKTIKGQTSEVKSEMTAPDIIQLVRKGDRFIMYGCKEGEPLKKIAEYSQPMGASGYLGLAVCSHNEDVIQEMIFSNVRITREAEESKASSREGALSRMEILDIESLNRMVIYQDTRLFEAPNWSARENMLIYNSEGLLYKLPVSGGNPVLINTDFANRLNNDHGISPDGKWLAISHHREEAAGGGSTVYVLPYEGGKPRQVTEFSPSYWHGWSADSKTVAYVGERNNGNYDIYTVSRNGGKEKRLTSSECLDDGPDYTADGRYIYFNSCRSGKMQIWRMNPDGTNQEQVTTGDYNDWFPHPSPDGKWLVFISYLPEVAPADHPPNKHVMLRMMPLQGGEIKVIAHLYGGQGTINVPSWSPDSKKIAFVSYTY